MHASIAAGEPTNSAEGGQYLTFLLRQEEYAIDILKVQEIKGLPRITPVPNTPTYLRGVMNLRGAVVPVADLRVRFSIPDAEDGRSSVVILANVHGRTVGLVVDAVSDVLSFRAADLEPTPNLGRGVEANFITGLAKVGDRLVLLLDIERLLGDETIADAA